MRISAQLGFTAANWDISAIHGDVWLIYDRFLFTSKPMIGHSEYISTHVANQRYCSAPQALFKKGYPLVMSK
jgi:predicted fused transcriptional regulator/phosphomethylpyrimidine kinase